MWDSLPPMHEEMAAFEHYLRSRFPTGNDRFEGRAAGRLFTAGGKRLRPAMTIASALCGRYKRRDILPAAAAMELLHTASLVHDDIIDHADMRRGQNTVSHEHGNAVAVYMGDYLLAESMLALADSPLEREASRRLALGVKAMCSGEIEQFFSRRSLPTTTQYLKRVMRKTALLFAASCTVGAMSAACPVKTASALARFGFNFGVAFQIRDDLLDLREESASIGKPAANDLEERLATLPLILAAAQSDALKAAALEYLQNGRGNKADLTAMVIDCGGPELAQSMLERYRDKCRANLSLLPQGTGRAALSALCAWL